MEERRPPKITELADAQLEAASGKKQEVGFEENKASGTEESKDEPEGVKIYE